MKIITSKLFDKKINKIQKSLVRKVYDKVTLFNKNPFDKLLNNHSLHGERKNLRSINITGDLRIIYEQTDKETVHFVDIDTHSNLY